MINYFRKNKGAVAILAVIYIGIAALFVFNTHFSSPAVADAAVAADVTISKPHAPGDVVSLNFSIKGLNEKECSLQKSTELYTNEKKRHLFQVIYQDITKKTKISEGPVQQFHFRIPENLPSGKWSYIANLHIDCPSGVALNIVSKPVSLNITQAKAPVTNGTDSTHNSN